MSEKNPFNFENKPVSLSEEWAELSAELCGPEYIDALGKFFESRKIQTLLECACGDGHVLSGIADKIVYGVGIDSDEYLISRAQQTNTRQNITYKQLSILDINTDPELQKQLFDAVMIRGNSITALGAWGTNRETFNPAICEDYIHKALTMMWEKLEQNGVLYLDVTKDEDIKKGNHTLQISLGGVNLVGEITIDVPNRRRDAFGHGTVSGKPFEGGSSSYLIGPGELKQKIETVLRPKKIWTPTDIKDSTYEIICVEK